MKKILNIFLAISMFFNLSFIFSEAKASIVPVPLTVIGNETYSSATGPSFIFAIPSCAGRADVDCVNKRLKWLSVTENLETAILLQAGHSSQIMVDIYNIPRDLNKDAQYSLLEYILVPYFLTNRTLDINNQTLINNRISEIMVAISAADQRINDLRAVVRSFILQIPGPVISSINSDYLTGDLNEVKQELLRSIEFKIFLEKSLKFWSSLPYGDMRITSISPSSGKSGDRITINGAGFQNALAVRIVQGYSLAGQVELFPSNIISDNRIDFTLPSISGIMNGIVNVFVFDKNGVYRTTSFTYSNGAVTCNPPPVCTPQVGCTYSNPTKDANGCVTGCGTLSCPNNNTCKCPAGQVSVTISGIKRCSNISLGSINCGRYPTQQVCGCDGVTYNNACYALLSGVITYTNGQCGRPRTAFRSRHEEKIEEAQEELFTINDPSFVSE